MLQHRDKNPTKKQIIQYGPFITLGHNQKSRVSLVCFTFHLLA